MAATVGLRVTRLRRVRMGPLALGAVPTGKWRELTKREVAALRSAGPGLAVAQKPSLAGGSARAGKAGPRGTRGRR
jgi:hypothetical protein